MNLIYSFDFKKLRKVALETYHRFECTVVDFLIASGMSIICFLAYRCITQKPLQFFLDNKETFKQHDETSGSNKYEVNFHCFKMVIQLKLFKLRTLK